MSMNEFRRLAAKIDGAASRHFMGAATCKSSSLRSTSRAGCIGNGYPT
jgi:hypothetical protein